MIMHPGLCIVEFGFKSEMPLMDTGCDHNLANKTGSNKIIFDQKYLMNAVIDRLKTGVLNHPL